MKQVTRLDGYGSGSTLHSEYEVYPFVEVSLHLNDFQCLLEHEHHFLWSAREDVGGEVDVTYVVTGLEFPKIELVSIGS
jgi:hypothetical protein